LNNVTMRCIKSKVRPYLITLLIKMTIVHFLEELSISNLL